MSRNQDGGLATRRLLFGFALVEGSTSFGRFAPSHVSAHVSPCPVLPTTSNWPPCGPGNRPRHQPHRTAGNTGIAPLQRSCRKEFLLLSDMLWCEFSIVRILISVSFLLFSSSSFFFFFFFFLFFLLLRTAFCLDLLGTGEVEFMSDGLVGVV